MTEIYRFTEGAVSPNDFYELPPIGQMQLPITETPAPLFDVQERSAPPELQAAA